MRGSTPGTKENGRHDGRPANQIQKHSVLSSRAMIRLAIIAIHKLFAATSAMTRTRALEVDAAAITPNAGANSGTVASVTTNVN
jgi:hypothetical protein